MDPVEGRVLLGSDAAGWVPLDEVAFASLRSRVVMVPQDGFLFDATVADNVRYGRPGMTDAADRGRLRGARPGHLGGGAGRRASRTAVGQRGESLSAGERQLVAVARAYVADPDLLVLDEATSAVDPATEQRLTRALDTLTDGRTTLTIAHRLSTAERADEILVVDAGHVVQRGTHAELVDADGPYAAAARLVAPVLDRRARAGGLTSAVRPAPDCQVAVLRCAACRRPRRAPGSRCDARPARHRAARTPCRAAGSARSPSRSPPSSGCLLTAEILYLGLAAVDAGARLSTGSWSSRCCWPCGGRRPVLVLQGRRARLGGPGRRRRACRCWRCWCWSSSRRARRRAGVVVGGAAAGRARGRAGARAAAAGPRVVRRRDGASLPGGRRAAGSAR